MITRMLGNTEMEVSEIGLGTNYVGGHNLYPKVDENAGVRIVRQALDSGITFIDTADSYGLGRSEELIGKALQGHTGQVVLATKGGIVFQGAERIGVRNDPAYLRAALEQSLRRLGRDHVDLYYIHKPDGKTAPEEAFGELMRLKEEGKIRAAGLSNFDVPGIRRAQSAGPVAAVQSQYNLLQRDVERDVLPYCREHGISFVPWGPLAYGLLGGKYDHHFRLSPEDWRSRSGLFDTDTFEKSLVTVEKLKVIAENRRIPPAHLAIGWLLSRPAVTSVIAGAKTPDQVTQNAEATGWEPDSSILSQIEEAMND